MTIRGIAITLEEGLRHAIRRRDPAPSVRPRPRRLGGARTPRRARARRRAICRCDQPGTGRADRSFRPARPDRAPVRARCGRARARARGAQRSYRRRRQESGSRHRASLSRSRAAQAGACLPGLLPVLLPARAGRTAGAAVAVARRARWGARLHPRAARDRSEEHTSELQSHSFISYAVFCLKKTKKTTYNAIATVRRSITLHARSASQL